VIVVEDSEYKKEIEQLAASVTEHAKMKDEVEELEIKQQHLQDQARRIRDVGVLASLAGDKNHVKHTIVDRRQGLFWFLLLL
jgi:hypothetical protein